MKTVETPEKVNQLINCLTNNEDHRQELWVHYLSGNPIDSFAHHLQKISTEYSDSHHVKEAIWFLINNPPSEQLLELLKSFSEFERSILCLLILGFDVEHISKHKGISQVRIRQCIASIRYNNAWYGIKETSDRRRKIRAE